MDLRSFFFGPRDDYTCEHLIKYDGRSIAIEGVSFDNIQIGKFGLERKVVQAASHALMLLDASQYSLCTSIRNIKDNQERDSLTKLMITDKISSEKIIHTLAALSFDPQSKELQATLKALIVTYAQRASKIEETQPTVTLTDDKLPTDSVEIETGTITNTVKDLERSDPALKEQKTVTGISAVQETSAAQLSEHQQDFNDLGNATISLRKEYNDVIMHKQSVSDLFQKLAPYLQQVTSNPESKDLIGKYYAEALNRYLINMSTEVEAYNQAMQIGGDKSAADQAERKIKLVSYQILASLDDIYSSLQRKA